MRHVDWYRDIKVSGEQTTEATEFSEISVCVYQTTQHHITEDSDVRNICNTPTSSLECQVSDNMPRLVEENRTCELSIRLVFSQLRLKMNKLYK